MYSRVLKAILIINMLAAVVAIFTRNFLLGIICLQCAVVMIMELRLQEIIHGRKPS